MWMSIEPQSLLGNESEFMYYAFTILVPTPSHFSSPRAHAKDKKNKTMESDRAIYLSSLVRIYITVCYLVVQIWMRMAAASKDILKSHDAPASQMRNKFELLITFDFKTHCHARMELVGVRISYVCIKL